MVTQSPRGSGDQALRSRCRQGPPPPKAWGPEPAAPVPPGASRSRAGGLVAPSSASPLPLPSVFGTAGPQPETLKSTLEEPFPKRGHTHRRGRGRGHIFSGPQPTRCGRLGPRRTLRTRDPRDREEHSPEARGRSPGRAESFGPGHRPGPARLPRPPHRVCSKPRSGGGGSSGGGHVRGGWREDGPVER